MGGLISSIFGGSSQKEQSQNQSSNQAYPMLASSLGGNIGVGNNALSQMASLLTGQGDQNGAFKNYLNSTGYNFMLNQGSNAITGNAAAKGMLGSGATLKALTNYGQNLGGQYFNNYLNQLGTLSDAGLKSAGIIGSVGQQSSGSSSGNSNSSKGILPVLFGGG